MEDVAFISNRTLLNLSTNEMMVRVCFDLSCFVIRVVVTLTASLFVASDLPQTGGTFPSSVSDAARGGHGARIR